MKLTDEFKEVSGLEIQPSKTEALWRGTWRDRADEFFGFTWAQEPIHALGIYFFYDRERTDMINFEEGAQRGVHP